MYESQGTRYWARDVDWTITSVQEPAPTESEETWRMWAKRTQHMSNWS